MGTPRFIPEFNRQITERGYSVVDVSERLGVSAHSLYKWLCSVKPDNSGHQARALLEARTEILKLKAQLKRTEEKRGILKMEERYFAREPTKGLCRVNSDTTLLSNTTLVRQWTVLPPI